MISGNCAVRFYCVSYLGKSSTKFCAMKSYLAPVVVPYVKGNVRDIRADFHLSSERRSEFILTSVEVASR